MSDPPRQMLSDHHKIELEGHLYRCPCGEKFAAAEHAVCPSCGGSIPEHLAAATTGEPDTCTDNTAPAAARRVGGGVTVSAGHRLHMEEAMAVQETETRIRSGAYAAANPETVCDRATFLAFVTALVRDAHRTPAPNRSAATFLATAVQWAANPKSRALPAVGGGASWKEFARFLHAGVTQEKGQSP